MQVTTLSFDNMHNHGELFANMLRARHKTFIEHATGICPKRTAWNMTSMTRPQAAGLRCTNLVRFWQVCV